jgi:hypothetical protein
MKPAWGEVDYPVLHPSWGGLASTSPLDPAMFLLTANLSLRPLVNSVVLSLQRLGFSMHPVAAHPVAVFSCLT